MNFSASNIMKFHEPTGQRQETNDLSLFVTAQSTNFRLSHVEVSDSPLFHSFRAHWHRMMSQKLNGKTKKKKNEFLA